jgi:ATP-binding cassette subfamily B protein
LKCLLEGFGTSASYGRLREACQTDVDGTSIDTVEDAARQLGLEAEQVMLPADHVLLKDSRVLPAIVAVKLPNGVTHFVVAWRRHGPLMQLMDPATGRRWVSTARFLDELYIHSAPVPAEGWRKWAGTEEFSGALRRRLMALGVRPEPLLTRAFADATWASAGALDAAARMVAALVRAGGVSKGTQAARLLEKFFQRPETIPQQFWSVRPAEEGELEFRGAVLVRVRGKRKEPAADLPAELAAALTESPSRPALTLLRLLRRDGVLAPAMIVLALAAAASAVLFEAVLFRGLFDLARELGISGQRLGAIGAVLVFLCGMLLLELPLCASLFRMGRHLETRLRQAFLEKIPRLDDRYFQSRLKSDMAERSHSVYRIRQMPDLGGHLVRAVFEIVLTAVGIAWVDPASAPMAAAAALVAIGFPLLVQPAVAERDMRVRTHTGALSRFYLDVLLGLVPIRVHGAQRAIRREHGKLLIEWARAAFARQRTAVSIEGLQYALGFALAAALLIGHLTRAGEAGGALLLVYWALSLPVMGQEIALLMWQYPSFRNVTLRLLEPLGALEQQPATTHVPVVERARAAAIEFNNVTVRAAGHPILQDIDLAIPAGSHVGIVGASGAGKSSLVGVLLGWYTPAAGSVLIDGVPIGECLDEFRHSTAWVDPTVHLWNRSFHENLTYGVHGGRARSMAQVIEAADLRRVLEKLPEGFETPLGESGGMLSGGEGQRVRLARALLRANARLAILDEPFRGLDREQRRELLARARRLWRGATLLCVTHDVGDTRGFDRVLVIDGGRVVEDGDPATLEARANSRYRALLEAEAEVREGLWSGTGWRRLRLEGGKVA